MDFDEYPDGVKRKIAAVLHDKTVYRIGEKGPIPIDCFTVDSDMVEVTDITNIGGYAGHVRVIFADGRQCLMNNAKEFWEPLEWFSLRETLAGTTPQEALRAFLSHFLLKKGLRVAQIR